MDQSIYSIIQSEGELLKLEEPLSCWAFYKNKKINLLTKEAFFSSLGDAEEVLLQKSLKQNENPCLYHLFYEWGYYYQGLEDKIKEDDLLLILLDYKKISPYELIIRPEKVNFNIKERPVRNTYKNDFSRGREHLLKGNCYQFNLTYPYKISFEDEFNIENIISSLWSEKNNRGEFAHLTYLETMDLALLSNSPECLFQIDYKKDNLELITKPIKGTLSLKKREDFEKVWKELSSSIKDQAELNMITDLMRNDLSKIGAYYSFVKKKKAPLIVPGLLHQYSEVRVSLDKKQTLGEVFKAIFPGGSITGAPKKRVMEILYSLEKNRRRGFYTGATFFSYKDQCSASINIRSGEIDLKKKEMTYFAGGGITLLSDPDEEFEEMEEKLKSFTRLFSNT